MGRPIAGKEISALRATSEPLPPRNPCPRYQSVVPASASVLAADAGPDGLDDFNSRLQGRMFELQKNATWNVFGGR